MASPFVEVVLPLPLRGPLIYRLPPSLTGKAQPGCRVQVPLGTKTAVGCLLNLSAPTPHFKTKEILALLDETPLLSSRELKFLRWTSAYYLTPIGEVLRHLVPPQLLRLRAHRSPLTATESGAVSRQPSARHLTTEQEEALKIILKGLSEGGPPILLHGITGSGKTDVYIEAVREVLRTGGQALVLVPEIGLTPQLLERFQDGLSPLSPQAVASYHSALTPSARLRVWEEVRKGTLPVVIATRSGIFLPFPNLRLIVVDEEQDSSYKQEERFCYHARDLALWRAREEKALALLGTATPSLETYTQTQKGKIRLVPLRERPAGALLPEVEVIDRRREKEKESILTPSLAEALRRNLARGEQSLLFLNRRGFAPFLLCPSCGFVPRCDSCDISLILHRGETDDKAPSPPEADTCCAAPAFGGLLVCHYCDRTVAYDPVCPTCRRGTLRPIGFGTERIVSELKRLLPGARIARMDRDTTRKKGGLRPLEGIKKGEIDILVGTQMVTKGHDYPGITLVGILDADQSLHLPDFRASERTFHLITQVSGRAGRGAKPGRVLIQTFRPDQASLSAAVAADGERFYTRELEQRLKAGYPPFQRLIEIRLAASRREQVISKGHELARRLQKGLGKEARLLGPAPCPMERVRGRTRWRLLIKTSSYVKIQPLLRRLLDDFAENDLPSRMKMLVNVDPVEMM